MTTTVYKNAEKVILWLYRTARSRTWLAKEMHMTIQAVSLKIQTNAFTDKDIETLKKLGCPI